MCGFRLLGEPALCPAAVAPTSEHRFCAAHERLYADVKVYGLERQVQGADKADAAARAKRLNPSVLKRVLESFDMNCIRRPDQWR
jgi:hypothetical protein